LPAGMLRWLSGDLSAAERFAREAMACPLDEVRQIAAYLLVRVLRLQGRHREVLEVCDDVIASGAPATTINTTWVGSAQAIARASLTRRPDVVDAAVAVAISQAERAEMLGQCVPAAYLLHDVVGFGVAEQICPSLDRLALSCDAPVVRILAAHVRALVHQDVEALQTVGRDASALGLGLITALATADCARLSSPGPSPMLTSREHEVALAAGAGMTDKEIGLHLGISVRTVNAHLRSVYVKLGLSSRRDLVLLHESGDRSLLA
jgi:DNA-binding CsgD family transcriptional regulator